MTATSLFALTSEAALLAARIDDYAERLFSEDLAEVAAATATLKQLITAESSNRSALTAKADAWCWVIDSLRAQATARREHAKRLAALADHAEHRAEVLQDQLVAALSRVNPDATKWELPEHKISSCSRPSVELEVEPTELPAEYQRTKTTVSADKPAITAALKAGKVIEGAQLVERRSWRIG